MPHLTLYMLHEVLAVGYMRVHNSCALEIRLPFWIIEEHIVLVPSRLPSRPGLGDPKWALARASLAADQRIFRAPLFTAQTQSL